MNVWLMESKNGINNEKKMSLADLQFLLISGVQRVLFFFESYLEEHFLGIYFPEITQNDRNRENTGSSVPLK